MRVAVTGTPGTGKTVATTRLEDRGHAVCHVNDVLREEGLYEGRDEERGSLLADIDAIEERLANFEGVIESHLAHRLPADRVVVLRCRPDVLCDRLTGRGESAASIDENAESEALDVILAEAVGRHGREAVYEIETTDREPRVVADGIEAVIRGDREPSAGTVDYTDYL